MKRLLAIFPFLAALFLMGWATIAAAETKNPHGEIKWDCQKCHTPDSWTQMRKPLTFAHDETDFPLIGVHRSIRCAGCHRDLAFSHVASACADCHSDPHQGQLGLNCQKCHTSEDWQNREDIFNLHAQKGFALMGVHAIADCNACHQGQRPEEFAATPITCQGCHITDYNKTQDPNHAKANFRFDCETCHSTHAASWRTVSWQHPSSFRLEGAHRTSSCNSCHATGYAGTPNNCFGCHENDFAGAQNPNHVQGNFNHDCATCHTVIAWSPANFDHNLSGFALTGAHRTVACNQCHKSGFAGTPTACYSCHQQDFAGTTQPNHVAGGFPSECLTCHTTSAWSPASFDHSRTHFALTGAHASVTCDKCHASGYAGTSTACYSCHATNFVSASDPNHVQNKLSHECEQCHTTTAWSPASFDHSTTSFPLTGAHQAVACAKCHATGYAGTPTTCYSCHKGDFADVKDPNHVTDAFDHDCLRCHSTAAWQPTTFDHGLTRFALTGAHQAVTCNNCHATGFDGTASTCNACHQTDFAKTLNPNHVTSGFPTECQVCHNTATWTPASFDHARTNFPLTGAHQAVVCSKCHATGYAGTPTACYSCHQSDYAGVSNPNHVTANFDHDCLKCHSTSAWKPSSFDHSTTAFALTGAHQAVTCDKCHASGFAGTPTNCYSCHQTGFAGVKDPDHVGSNFDHDCLKCHTTTAWSPAAFDHNLARFTLTGAHQAVACARCHLAGYTGTPAACYSCHQADFAGVKDPDHAANSFDHDCLKCHTTAAWLPVMFDHNTTSFRLTGAHLAVTCNTCHKTGFAGTASTCYACHQTDYVNASQPNHTTSGFPTDCQVCHATTAWSPANFDHSSTGFVLTGAHQGISCNKCHATGFSGTPTTCYACHQTDYADVKDPNHVADNFDHDCAKCHTTSGWMPASFDHNTARFQLTGAHQAVACNLCHATGYDGTSMACYSCHQTNYSGVTEPSHVLGNFDHDCLKCHTTVQWKPSTFNHASTGFALTGGHQALACSKCHATGYAGTPTACYSCHQTDYTGVVNPSHTVGNFDHDCLKCHTTAAWSPSTFDHGSTGFALTGAHRAVTCNTCHKTAFAGTPSTCYACHQTDYAGTTQPNHMTAGLPTQCQVCHTATAWSPASFDHSGTGFPLIGAHQAIACNQCHAAGYTGTPTDCYSCHQGNYTAVTDPNHVLGTFDHDCTKCHTMNGWKPSTFNHASTGFTLTGAHQTLACSQCHATGFAGTPTDCYSCHQTNYASVTDPNHVTNNFDHDCTKCHSMTAWKPATFNHNLTVFPLTGAHQAVACIQCHATQYAGTPTACYSCHAGDFTGVTDPNHVTGNFDHDCTKCHSMIAWTPATFDHNSTGFPLTGAHTAVTCNSCHKTGFAGTPSTCYACHQTDYAGTSNPNHAAASFPTDCQACHTTTAWSPANWNHDSQYFPIYSGSHRGRWTLCTDCHVNPASFASFECILCHTHDKTTTDSHHQGVRSYQYLSSACYSCHPTGRAED
jgi:hypothetical protein